MDNQKILAEAIKNRYLISFNYKGHRRIAEPYHYGFLQKDSTADNENYFLCYQIEGSSNGGKLGFKCMFLDLMSELEILPTRPFTPRKDYNPHDLRWNITFGIYS